MSRFTHRNNRQRFDLYSFYALLVKCKIEELLDQEGNTPFDSDTIDQNVWNYAAYLYKDISDVGLLPYLDSDSLRSDSDGAGSTAWPAITKTDAITEAYKPLRRFLCSLDSDEGINNISNTITSGFNRTYYTLPLSDSEGTIKHINIYAFLKTHVDRWLQFDPYERRKLASRIIDNLAEDSDVRYRYSHNFLRASEEDSDLARRLTEIYSNVLQSDSDSESSPRQEFIQTIITGLRGLTPGGDSDAAIDLGHVITAVLNNNSDSDSDIRNKFGDLFIDALRKDSDTADSDLQNRLRDIISNTELLSLESPLVVTRKLMPMDSDDTGSIGDSEFKFSLANFSTLRSDNVKIDGLTKDRLLDVSDSEGKLSDTQDSLQWQGDSELTVTHVNVTVDARLSTARVSDLSKDRIVYSSDSDGRTSTSSNLQWQGDSELVIPHLKVTNDSRLATARVSDLSKDRIVYSSDSDGRLRTNLNIQFQNNDELVVTNLNVSNDSKFNATRVTDIRKDGLVFVSDSDGRLNADSDLEFTRDSDKLVLSYQGRRQLALDSEKFFNLLIANDQYYTLDSEGVDSVITDTPVKSETSWVIGQKGDVYFIDSDQSNQLETKPLVYITDKVIDTAAELARATNDRVTKLTVFNTWARFSHQYNGGGTPGTFTYPAVLAEEQGWAYDAGADLIYTTVNSVSYAGFVSSDTYQNYTFDSIFKTYNDNTNDDDVISSVIGFVTEGIKGQSGYREHTLQVIRNSGGFPMTQQNFGNVTWALVYNYNQDDVRLLVNKTTSAPVATAPWNSYPYGTKVFIKRTGNIIKAYCSQMNDSTYTLDSDTEIIWDLSSDSDTNKFRGPVRYGYGVHSQKGASWSDIVFKPDQGTYLHYMPDGATGSSGGNVYEYNIDSERWSIDTSLTVDNTVGNRLLHNSSTRKTFFNNPSDDKVYQIMTASKFTDVMNLPILTSAPAVSVAGTFAIADGVGWDPIGYGAPAYIVFNDGTDWYYVDAQ